MSQLCLHPIQKLSINTASMVSQDPSLRFLFSVVHTAHKWWKWRQDANLVFQYFNNPTLALGDLAASNLSNYAIYNVVAIALGTLRSLWEAEQTRGELQKEWKRLKWHLLNPKEVPFHPSLLNQGLQQDFFLVAIKIKVIFQLVFRLFQQSFCLSMHLIDAYEYSSNQAQRERAKTRAVSNAFFLNQEFRKIACSLNKPNELPFFEKINLNIDYLTKLHKHLNQIIELLTALKEPSHLTGQLPSL